MDQCKTGRSQEGFQRNLFLGPVLTFLLAIKFAENKNE